MRIRERSARRRQIKGLREKLPNPRACNFNDLDRDCQTVFAPVYAYATGRSGEHATALLKGFKGVLQVDAYCGYNADRGDAPLASEALQYISQLYVIEERIRRLSAEARRTTRQAERRPIVEEMKAWLEMKLPLLAVA